MKPKKIRICDADWRIEYKQIDGRLGETRLYEGLIIINSEFSLETQRQALTHEILHACRHMGAHKIDDEAEERFIRAVEIPLMSTLRANKAWWK